MGKIRIIIADNNTSVIKKFASALSTAKDIEILKTTTSGYEVAADTAFFQPDILLIGIDMETVNSGIKIAKILHKNLPSLKTILLAYDVDSTSYKAYNAGFADILSKETDSANIISSIKQIYQSDVHTHNNIEKKLYKSTMHPNGVRDSLMYTLSVISLLTPMELDILKLILQGENIDNIHEIKGCKKKIIADQLSSILNKFNKQNLDELITVLKTLNIDDILYHNY